MKANILKVILTTFFLFIGLASVKAECNDECLANIFRSEFVEKMSKNGSEDLIKYFEDNTTNAYKAWRVLYKADKSADRFDLTNLTELAEFITSSKKAPPSIVKEIVEAGGFAKWKLQKVRIVGDMTGLKEVSITDLKPIIESNGVTGKGAVKSYAGKIGNGGYNVDDLKPINIVELEDGTKVIADADSHYRVAAMSQVGGSAVPVKHMTLDDLSKLKPSSKRQRVEKELYYMLKIGQQTGSYKKGWFPKMDWADEIELFDEIPNKVDDFLTKEFPNIVRVVPLRSIDEIVNHVKYSDAKKQALKEELLASKEKAKLFGNTPDFLNSWDQLYDINVSKEFKQDLENLFALKSYMDNATKTQNVITAKSFNQFVKNQLDKDAYMRSILFKDGLYGGIPVSKEGLSEVKLVRVKVTSPQYSGSGKFGSYEVRFNGGKIERHVVGTNGNGAWKGLNGGVADDLNFVITRDGKLRIGHGHYNLSGEAEQVVSAGKMLVVDGKVVEISNYSGHYLPSNENLYDAEKIFKELGVTRDDFKVFENPNAKKVEPDVDSRTIGDIPIDDLVASIRKRLTNLKDPARPILDGQGIPLEKGKFSKELGTNRFENIITGNQEEASKKYMWTIDDDGINIGLEQTSIGNNSEIKHSNLSPKAYSGGEVWFTDLETIYINAWSGRFGSGANMTKIEWEASIDAWKSLGYKVVIEPYTP